MDGWRKSTYSADTANCVEVAVGAVVTVRDSKLRDGPQLLVDTAEWQRWLDLVKAGGYDR